MTASAPRRHPPLPRTWAITGRDIAAALVGVGVIVVAMWARHGGLSRDPVAGIGQVTGLLGTYLALVGVLAASRAPWLDQTVGADRLAVVHRWTGFAVFWLLTAHVAFSSIAFAAAAHTGIVDDTISLVQTTPGMLGSIVGFGLFVLVTVTSIRYARRRVSYETWHALHLYAYLAIAFGFLHQLTVGTDFITDPVAQVFWVGLYAVAILPLVIYRWLLPIAHFARHRFVVANVVREAPDVVSVHIGGHDLSRFPVRSGQWFRLRFLTSDAWWRAHPYSLSAAPDGRTLRFTIKALGDGSAGARWIRPGTRVILEGPYGAMHGGARRNKGFLLIAGGIGITPLRAILEGVRYDPGDVVLLYRARGEGEIIFRHEIDVLAAHRGATVHYLVGPRGRTPASDPLGPASIAAMVPDVLSRDAFICGPTGLMDLASGSLRDLGVPEAHIHAERFAY